MIEKAVASLTKLGRLCWNEHEIFSEITSIPPTSLHYMSRLENVMTKFSANWKLAVLSPSQKSSESSMFTY